MFIDYSFIIQITFIIIHIGSALIDKRFICVFVVVVPTAVIYYLLSSMEKIWPMDLSSKKNKFMLITFIES